MTRQDRLLATMSGHVYVNSPPGDIRRAAQRCGRVAVLSERAMLSYVALSIDEYEALLTKAGEGVGQAETT